MLDKQAEILLNAHDRIKSLIISVQQLRVKIVSSFYDEKHQIGCIVIDESTSNYVIGKIKKIISKYDNTDVNIVKNDGLWYLTFKEEHINMLGEYIDIMKEIV